VTFSVLPPRPRGACPVIRELYPPSIPAGSAFNRRPDGSSTLGVAGEKFGPRSEVLFGGRELRTTYQGPGSLVAVVPAESTLRKGSVRVAIRDPECPASSSFAVFDVK
jgi:hypothetical protein